MERIAPNVFRFTAAHPEWTSADGDPGGWERDVASLVVLAEGAVVFIDPQVPQAKDEARELEAILGPALATPGAELHIVIANAWHSRSAQALHDRYTPRVRAAIHAPRDVARQMPCKPTFLYGDGAALPGGIVAHRMEGLHPGEHVLHIPDARALVAADAFLGHGAGRVRLAAPGWSPDPARYPELPRSLHRLLDLPCDMLLPSHGNPVLTGGRAALAAALEATTGARQ